MKVYIVFDSDFSGGDRVDSVWLKEEAAKKREQLSRHLWYDEFEVKEEGMEE